MKKITALFLALALCLSLCTVTAFAGTISTIADVLATVDGGFPTTTTSTPPANAWTDGNGKNAYMDKDNFVYTGIFNANSTCTVYSEGDNYVYESSVAGGQYAFTAKLTFRMENDVLTSIDCVATGYFEAATGTYTAPAPTYTVTISPAEHGTVTATPTNVASGTDVTLTVTPDEGYQLKTDSLKVTASGTDIPVTGSGNSYSFVMPNENVNVTAQFEYAGGGHHHGGGSTTPVVSAPKTADMGVAIYGVLTVSSLLGMGWISKKKR